MNLHLFARFFVGILLLGFSTWRSRSEQDVHKLEIDDRHSFSSKTKFLKQVESEVIASRKLQVTPHRQHPISNHQQKPATRAAGTNRQEYHGPRPPMMVALPSPSSNRSIDLFDICPQLLTVKKLKYARLFEIRINPSYHLALYPPGELISDFVVKDGSWELELITALAPHVHFYPGEIIVNAGGNIGTLAIYYAMAAFEVFTMEPHPVNFMLLNCSAHINHLAIGKNIHLYNQALGSASSPGKLCFNHVLEDNMGMARANTKTDGDCQFYAPTISLNSFIVQHAETFRNRFLLLLLDLESYEPPVLQDLQSIFADATLRPKLVVLETDCARWKEVNKWVTHCMQVPELLFKHGYTPIWPTVAVQSFTEYLVHKRKPRNENVIFAIKESA